MDRPGFKPVDRSAKLLQAIVQEDHETFNAILPDCKPDEVSISLPLSFSLFCRERVMRDDRDRVISIQNARCPK